MRPALALRTLTAGETRQLKAGLRSTTGFTVRRSQILLASANAYSPTQIASVVGCNAITVTRVIADFHARGVTSVHEERRQPGPRRPSRPRIEEREPGITAALERLLVDETAGDPMGRRSWVRSSLRKLSDALGRQGYRVDPCTVRKLLRRMGFTLKRNQKRRGGSQHPGRDEQFRYIAARRAAFAEAGLPVISVDTKHKELIGNFRNPGRAWRREAEEVSEHDFTSTAQYRAVPFGVYDVQRNKGYVTVGISNDTPEFAVKAIARWWVRSGRAAYPRAGELLILADCGGTNGCRCRAWKLLLQERLCDRYGLKVTACHYPPGCSKWNPIEHRLFSQISTNWAGRPLRTLDLMLGYIRGTSTRIGLRVKADLDARVYSKDQKVTRETMARVNIEPHPVLPDWNYTLSPRALR